MVVAVAVRRSLKRFRDVRPPTYDCLRSYVGEIPVVPCDSSPRNARHGRAITGIGTEETDETIHPAGAENRISALKHVPRASRTLRGALDVRGEEETITRTRERFRIA